MNKDYKKEVPDDMGFLRTQLEDNFKKLEKLLIKEHEALCQKCLNSIDIHGFTPKDLCSGVILNYSNRLTQESRLLLSKIKLMEGFKVELNTLKTSYDQRQQHPAEAFVELDKLCDKFKHTLKISLQSDKDYRKCPQAIVNILSKELNAKNNKTKESAQKILFALYQRRLSKFFAQEEAEISGQWITMGNKNNLLNSLRWAKEALQSQGSLDKLFDNVIAKALTLQLSGTPEYLDGRGIQISLTDRAKKFLGELEKEIQPLINLIKPLEPSIQAESKLQAVPSFFNANLSDESDLDKETEDFFKEAKENNQGEIKVFGQSNSSNVFFAFPHFKGIEALPNAAIQDELDEIDSFADDYKEMFDLYQRR